MGITFNLSKQQAYVRDIQRIAKEDPYKPEKISIHTDQITEGRFSIPFIEAILEEIQSVLDFVFNDGFVQNSFKGALITQGTGTLVHGNKTLKPAYQMHSPETDCTWYEVHDQQDNKIRLFIKQNGENQPLHLFTECSLERHAADGSFSLLKQLKESTDIKLIGGLGKKISESSVKIKMMEALFQKLTDSTELTDSEQLFIDALIKANNLKREFNEIKASSSKALTEYTSTMAKDPWTISLHNRLGELDVQIPAISEKIDNLKKEIKRDQKDSQDAAFHANTRNALVGIITKKKQELSELESQVSGLENEHSELMLQSNQIEQNYQEKKAEISGSETAMLDKLTDTASKKTLTLEIEKETELLQKMQADLKPAEKFDGYPSYHSSLHEYSC